MKKILCSIAVLFAAQTSFASTTTFEQLKTKSQEVAKGLTDGENEKGGGCTMTVVETASELEIAIKTDKDESVSIAFPKGRTITLHTKKVDGSYESYSARGVGSVTFVVADDAYDYAEVTDYEGNTLRCGNYY